MEIRCFLEIEFKNFYLQYGQSLVSVMKILRET